MDGSADAVPDLAAAPSSNETRAAKGWTTWLRRGRFDAVVIGGGQAGLAVGHFLARQQRNFVILDAHARVGDAWRTRWDGLRLFTPGRLNSLPGMPFPGDPHGFPTKDEVADYLEAYATTFDLPVQTGVRVTDVWPADDGRGFRIVTDDGDYEATQVVVATGAYDRPRVPDFASDLDPAITQLHSSEFRSTSQLRDGTVLVVGASNSGAEIALMAAREHPTSWSGRDVGKMPFRPEDRLARTFDTFFWFFVNHVATLDNPIGRKAAPASAITACLSTACVHRTSVPPASNASRPEPLVQRTECHCSRMAASSTPPTSSGRPASGWITSGSTCRSPVPTAGHARPAAS